MNIKKRKTRKWPDMFGAPRKQKMKRVDWIDKLSFSLPVMLIMVMIGCGCSSHHYFSINAEEITNPQIEYSDSTRLYNPF